MHRPRFAPVHAPLALAAALALLSACDGPTASAAASGRPKVGIEAAEVCEVDVEDRLLDLRASEHGVALLLETDGGQVVRRLRGDGCDLAVDGTRPIAASALLDFDDRGDVYVFPAAARSPGVVSTKLEEGGAEGVVERVDVDGAVSPVVHAGRGIWSFGVAPEGDAFWVTACGPTGIFSTAEPELTPALPSPDTLWQALPSVLTDATTLWSLGYATCTDPPPSPSCGYALTRTTADGSEDLGSTVMDFGAGYEPSTLARCGAQVCGWSSSAVVVWDDAGGIEQTIALADLPGGPGGRIVGATGSGAGTYVLVEEPIERRALFVSRPGP